jgi:hypothetical protein
VLQREREREQVDPEQPEDDEAARAEAVSDQPGRDLHQRVHQRRGGVERPGLREGEVQLVADQRQEQGDPADRQRLRALTDHQHDRVDPSRLRLAVYRG